MVSAVKIKEKIKNTWNKIKAKFKKESEQIDSAEKETENAAAESGCIVREENIKCTECGDSQAGTEKLSQDPAEEETNTEHTEEGIETGECDECEVISGEAEKSVPDLPECPAEGESGAEHECEEAETDRAGFDADAGILSQPLSRAGESEVQLGFSDEIVIPPDVSRTTDEYVEWQREQLEKESADA